MLFKPFFMQMARILPLFCFFTASYTWIAAQEQVLNQFPCYSNFIRYPNRTLLSSKISTVQAADVGECILHCAKESSCKSINFATESEAATKAHRCELMQQDRYSEIEKFADSSVFDHYGPRSPCERLPCANGGTCVTNYINNTFSCDCQPGYQGKHCEEIDICSSNPCQNGGTCSNLIGSYRCTCAVEFRGSNCQYGPAPQCNTYTNLTETDRHVSVPKEILNFKCDKTLKRGWYRFASSAGVAMPTSCTPENKCNTKSTGWLDGAHPTVPEGVISRRVCFHWWGRCCNWQTNIQVLNCSGFYVYELMPPPKCDLRYCIN